MILQSDTVTRSPLVLAMNSASSQRYSDDTIDLDILEILNNPNPTVVYDELTVEIVHSPSGSQIGSGTVAVNGPEAA